MEEESIVYPPTPSVRKPSLTKNNVRIPSGILQDILQTWGDSTKSLGFPQVIFEELISGVFLSQGMTGNIARNIVI